MCIYRYVHPITVFYGKDLIGKHIYLGNMNPYITKGEESIPIIYNL